MSDANDLMEMLHEELMKEEFYQKLDRCHQRYFLFGYVACLKVFLDKSFYEEE